MTEKSLEDFGTDSEKGEASNDEYETMTAAEVVEKLEEVRVFICKNVVSFVRFHF